MRYGRFLLVMAVTIALVKWLFGNTWLAVAVALLVNVIISWPREKQPPREEAPSGRPARLSIGAEVPPSVSRPEPEPTRRA
jgi:hypothetical protein